MTTPSYREKVEQIDEITNEICNDWEEDFIRSMLDWDGEYTEKQKEVIDKLWKKACESPY